MELFLGHLLAFEIIDNMAKRTKKAGVVGKYGTRYGASLRKVVKRMEVSQHARYNCMFCGKVSCPFCTCGAPIPTSRFDTFVGRSSVFRCCIVTVTFVSCCSVLMVETSEGLALPEIAERVTCRDGVRLLTSLEPIVVPKMLVILTTPFVFTDSHEADCRRHLELQGLPQGHRRRRMGGCVSASPHSSVDSEKMLFLFTRKPNR
jgi:hypothetical protein